MLRNVPVTVTNSSPDLPLLARFYDADAEAFVQAVKIAPSESKVFFVSPTTAIQIRYVEFDSEGREVPLTEFDRRTPEQREESEVAPSVKVGLSGAVKS